MWRADVRRWRALHGAILSGISLWSVGVPAAKAAEPAIAAASAANASAALDAASAQPRPVLVELFTSEGCSSCPPADELLRQLSEAPAVAGAQVIALSEHVTYWNQLGWRDRFSADAFTDRQQAYGEHFRLDSVYTPQMVIDGVTQLVGSDRAAVLAAIHRQAAAPAAAQIRIASVRRAGATLNLVVDMHTPAGTPPGAAQLIAVLADDHDETRVLRGENGGSTLRHVDVARALATLGAFHAGDGQSFTLVAGASSEPQHVVLLAQDRAGRVLGAATAPVPAR